jgi:hypothetical protein
MRKELNVAPGTSARHPKTKSAALKTAALRINLGLLLLIPLCLYGCSKAAAQPAGGFANGSGATLGTDEVSFIAEVFNDSQGTITRDFPLPQPVRIDALNGTISFYRLNGHCGDENIATVGYLNADGGPIAIWDFQDTTNEPLSAVFPGGVMVTSLHFQSYNDLCLPTNFRLALTMHRAIKETE